MKNDQDLGGDAKQGTIISACEDRQTREVKAIEGFCPLCSKPQEYFSDELRAKDKLRCQDCKETFDAAIFRKQAGL